MVRGFRGLGVQGLPIGSLVVPFYGSYLEADYKVVPKRNYP